MISEHALRPVHIEFVTDIDNNVLKRILKYNSGLDINRINPLVGDYICVEHAFGLYMKVISRSWILVNGSPDRIVIKLTDPFENDEYKMSFLEWLQLTKNSV